MLVKVILYNHLKVIELLTVTVCFWFDVENQMCVKCTGMFFLFVQIVSVNLDFQKLAAQKKHQKH